MKTYVTNTKKYLSIFVIFSLLLCASLSAFIILGKRTAGLPDGNKPDSESITATERIKTVVVIDAGHGGEDGGTVGINGALEKELNLSVALKLDAALQKLGVTTRLTRSEDVLLYDKNSDHKGQKKVQDLAARRKIAEEYKDAIFVSIHMNSFPEEKYKGLQVYFSENNEQSLIIAQGIQTTAAEALQPENTRQCKSGTNIYLLEHLSCPAVLIECGFLSNKEECLRLSDEDYQTELAAVIAAAIFEHLSSQK